MINLSASPFDHTHDEGRKAVVKSNVLKYKLPMFYCNAVGSQTEIVLDGASPVLIKTGNLCEVASERLKRGIGNGTLNNDGSIGAAIVKPASPLFPTAQNTHQFRRTPTLAVFIASGAWNYDYFSKWVLKACLVLPDRRQGSYPVLGLRCAWQRKCKWQF